MLPSLIPSLLASTLLLAALCVLGSNAAAQAPEPLFRTVPEASAYARTSSLQEVQACLERLFESPLAPRLERRLIGHSAGRPVGEPLPIEAWILKGGPGARLRLLVVANIHGGEVEGKEAVQLLLRELAEGQHAGLLEAADLAFVPVYNVDGNQAVARTNRVEQNGPVEGVGERTNGQGLDLNRDLLKVEAPETRALLGFLRQFDPHLVLDLHTTNGTDHGYDLTYATSLVPELDPDLALFAEQRLLPTVRARLSGLGVETVDYGNLESEEGRPGGTWQSFDARPRFFTNYVGLRNRISVLSEAFSYADFERRIRATRAFVLATLEFAVEEQAQILARTAAADRRCADLACPLELPLSIGLEPAWPMQLLLQRVEEVPVELEGRRLGLRRMATWERRTVDVLAQVHFRAGGSLLLPAAWAIADPSAEVLARLAAHGIQSHRLKAPWQGSMQRFEIQSARQATRPFQGHRERVLEGTFVTGEGSLPQGALIVPRAQPLARLAAWLLEPQSEDSLTTWNFFDGELSIEGSPIPAGQVHPVSRLSSVPH